MPNASACSLACSAVTLVHARRGNFLWEPQIGVAYIRWVVSPEGEVIQKVWPCVCPHFWCRSGRPGLRCLDTDHMDTALHHTTLGARVVDQG